MSRSKLMSIVLASIIGLTTLIAGAIFLAPNLSFFENFKKDPYTSTVREVTMGFELLGREYAASGMTFGAMIAQTEASKRNFDSLLLKLPSPTTEKERANEKLVKEYILSASNVAYTLGRYLNAHMQMDIAEKSVSTSADTSACGSNYGSLSMTTCLVGLQFKQQEAFQKAESMKRAKAAAQSEKSSAISRLRSARDNLIKAGYTIDDQISNATNQLGRNI